MSKYDSIPAGACTFAAPIEVRDNGDSATTAPFSILARSSKPIEHWFWGNVVHDSAGAFGKDRIPIDYNHDEPIGFANKREITAEGVRLSGALTSVIPGDRADVVMKQAKAGIPFEASINFGGDGIVIEEVPDGQFVEVNGYQFTNGIVIREWPLRGCAFCPYGADGNTETELFSSSANFSATIINTETEATSEMSTPKTEAGEAVDTAVELANVEAVEATDTAPAELTKAVEEEVAEVAELAAVEAVEAEAETVEVATFTAESFAKMVTDFGQDIAVQTATNGGNYNDAKELHQAAERAELEALRLEVAQLKSVAPVAGTTPAAAFSVDTPAKPAKKRIGQASVRKLN